MEIVSGLLDHFYSIRIPVRALVYCIVSQNFSRLKSNFLKSEGGGPTGSQTRNYGLALAA